MQDTSAADWWGRWAPTYRDVVILDGEGRLVTTFNLTDRPVTEDANYAALRDLLIDTAQN